MLDLTRRSEDSSIDPLARALSPPPKETPEQRALREANEAEARRVSDRIDEQIKSEKQANSRQKIPVKVLMLGQAESGTPHPSIALAPLSFFSQRTNDDAKIRCFFFLHMHFQASRRR
jgi:hypothetical protein